MIRATLRSGGVLLALAASPAAAQQKDIAPYIELSQLLTADFISGDVLTYSQIAAGVDASIQTRNAQAQLSYRYERHIGWDDDVGQDDVHYGLAQAAVGVAPGITLEGGALATRARSDIRGAAPVLFGGDVDNVTQVYALYVGPSLSTQAGALSVNASYQYGYTKVEAPGYTGVGPGEPRLDYYDDSNSHVVQASVGSQAGDLLPVGVTVSGAYEREDAGQLDQRYEGYYARGDVLVPVSRTVALAGGVGYEKIETSQRDALLAGNGAPVLDENGRFVTDPASPRRIAYRTDGVIWDAGVVWRPSPRASLEAHVGQRYGSTTYFGSASYAASETVGMQLVVYDDVYTFARQLRHGLEGLPASFTSLSNQFANPYSGCVFGTTGAAAGGCLNDVFQSISTASYHARGIDGVISASRGPVRYGVGAGYSNRHLFAPDTGVGYTITGLEDESYYAQAFLARQLDPNSSIEGDLFASYYDPGFVGADGVFSTGAIGTYNRSFGRLNALASLGIYASEQGDDSRDVSGQALVGMRYQF